MQLAIMNIPPGGTIPEEVHSRSDQFIYLVKGRARIKVKNGRSYRLAPEEAFLVPKGTTHEVENLSPVRSLLLFTMYAPPVH